MPNDIEKSKFYKLLKKTKNFIIKKMPEKAFLYFFNTVYKKNKLAISTYSRMIDLAIKQKNYEKALQAVNLLISNYPNQSDGYIKGANVSIANKKWDNALDYLNICINKFPNDIKPDWLRKKGRILVELGRAEEAQLEALKVFKTQNGQAYANIVRRKLDRPTSHTLKFQHILIVTYGRSGSTLLQGILNTIDGVLIRGENNNLFFDFFKSYKKLKELKNKFGFHVLPNRPFFGIGFYDESILLKNLQQLANGILLGELCSRSDNIDYCIGFKEIKYHEIGNNFEEYLDFLNRIFPNAAFIFNTRNIEDVIESGCWKTKSKRATRKKLQIINAKFESYAITHSNCFQIRYEDVIKNRERLKHLYSFLGAQYDSKLVDSTLAAPHSYKPSQAHVKALFETNNALNTK